MPQHLSIVMHMQEDFDVIDEFRGANLDQRALRIPKPSAFGSPKVCRCPAPVIQRSEERPREPAADTDWRRPGHRAAPAAGWDRAGLWSEIERLAVEMAAREPFLRHMLDETVLSHETPGQIVSAALSRRLGSGRAQDATLQALVTETLGEDHAVLELLEADLVAVTTRDPACRSCLHALLNLKGFHALQSHRVAHSLWTRGRHDVAHWLSNQASVTLGVDIHPAVPIGKGVMLDHATGIVIGETAVVEDDVSILQDVTLGATGNEGGDRHPKVRRGAMLGAGAKILGNVEIGRMSKIGAGSVVVSAVPPYCTVTGVPAKVVRTRVPNGVES